MKIDLFSLQVLFSQFRPRDVHGVPSRGLKLENKNIQTGKVYYRSPYYTLAPEVFLEMVLRERESGRWDKDSFLKASSGCKTDHT